MHFAVPQAFFCFCSHEEFPEDWFEGLHPDLYRATRYITDRNKYKVQRCRTHRTLCSFLLGRGGWFTLQTASQ